MRLLALVGFSMITMVFSAHTTAATKAPAPVNVTLAWNLSLDANGHVVRLEKIGDSRADRIPEIRSRVEQAVRGWQFIPGMIDGKPAATQTRLTLGLSLLAQSAQALAIRVDSAATGAWYGTHVGVRYPATAIRHHRVGEVVLTVGFDADGKVTSVAPTSGAPSVDQSLIDAAITSVKKWTFRPESVGGHGVAGSVITPFCFQIDPHTDPGCLWRALGQDSALAQGEAFALNPVARLTTDVAGRIL